jgi:hypothetical protein
VQALAGDGVEDDAAPAGHHSDPLGEHAREDLALAGAERGLALALELRGDREPGLGLDHRVEVRHARAEPLAQHAGHRGLPRSHEPDQRDRTLFPIPHAREPTGCRGGKRSAAGARGSGGAGDSTERCG